VQNNKRNNFYAASRSNLPSSCRSIPGGRNLSTFLHLPAIMISV